MKKGKEAPRRGNRKRPPAAGVRRGGAPWSDAASQGAAGPAAPALLRPLGIKLPMAQVHGYSITAPLRSFEGPPEAGPRAMSGPQSMQ